MQQRTYQGGTAAPAGLADYLVQQFGETRRQRAQILGRGDSLIVQIGREGRTPALTLGIGRRTEAPQGTGSHHGRARVVPFRVIALRRGRVIARR